MIHHDLQHSGVRASPAIDADGTIYFGSEDKKVYAIKSDGTKKWELVTGGAAQSPAIAADGTLYVGSFDNKIYAIGSGSR
jgi:eukaryotic-like serine/threonine-protein kinase